jgi:hypothetical protein
MDTQDHDHNKNDRNDSDFHSQNKNRENGKKHDEMNWLHEFEDMANDQLNEGSACDQVHPIVERWLDNWLESDIPEPRSAVAQAVACLATEMIGNAPETLLKTLMEHCDEDEVMQWVQGILITGQAFQSALDKGQLDDL